MFLNMLQSHGQEGAEHGQAAAANTAGHATEGAGQGAHVPCIVEKLNDLFGEEVFEIQKAIMPPIYKALSFLFGDHWPGEGMTYESYRASGYLPIPTHVG